MRIGIDARELCGRSTGVGRYLSGLLDEWSSQDDQRRHEFVLYAHTSLNYGFDSRRLLFRTVPGDGGTVWEQIHLPIAVRHDHLDVLFAPAYTAPLVGSIPTVVAIHDVSFLAHPEWFRTREGLRRRVLTRRAAEAARAIIAISEFSKRELLERLGIPEHRVHVVPPGVKPFVKAPSTAAREPRLLFVGSIFNRRHVPDLIRAFAPLAERHPDVSLDIVGDNRSYPHEDVQQAIASEGLNQRVRWQQYVSEDALHALYATSRAFAFLSEYEGLGLPPLEGLAAGLPAVLLDTPVARESCGNAAIYVPLGERLAITNALEDVLFDENQRARMLAAAPAALAKYQWPHAASRTMAVLKQAASPSQPVSERE